MKRVLLLSILIVVLGGASVLAQGDVPSISQDDQDAFSQILQFLYTISHWFGEMIVSVIHAIVPELIIPLSLVDAIGILAMLTLFIFITEVAKKIAWVVVGVGWVLIVVRIVMIVLEENPVGVL